MAPPERRGDDQLLINQPGGKKMAKRIATVRYTDDYSVGSNSFQYERIAMESASKTKIVTTDAYSGDHLILIGRNFGLDHGLPGHGTIDKIIISDHDGAVLYTYSNLRMNVGVISGANLYDYALSLIFTASLKDTKYVGTDFTDFLTGFQGNDILLGRAETISSPAGSATT
jgi:hypothetical protein